jgi:hypothetical protein
VFCGQIFDHTILEPIQVQTYFCCSPRDQTCSLIGWVGEHVPTTIQCSLTDRAKFFAKKLLRKPAIIFAMSVKNSPRSVLLILLFVFSMYADAAHQDAELPREERESLFRLLTTLNGEALPSDPAGSEGLGFAVPNEFDNYLHELCLEGLAGVLLSVGTFRSLNLASSGKVSRLILFDYDKAITTFNLVNTQLINQARNRYEYLSLLFTGEIDDELVKSAHDKHLGLSDFLNKLESTHGKENADLRRKWLARVHLPRDYQTLLGKMTPAAFKEAMTSLGNALPSFDQTEKQQFSIVTDDTRFQRIKQMIANGKVNVMLGDLTGNALKSLGELLKKSNEQVSAVDASNVPGYFVLPNSTSAKMTTFVKNLNALPLTDRMNLLFTEETRFSSLAKDYRDKGRWFHYCLEKADFNKLLNFHSSKNYLMEYQKFLDQSFKPVDGTNGLLRRLTK